jgi:hypothetical protein
VRVKQYSENHQALNRHLEVSECSKHQWQDAVLQGFSVWRKLPKPGKGASSTFPAQGRTRTGRVTSSTFPSINTNHATTRWNSATAVLTYSFGFGQYEAVDTKVWAIPSSNCAVHFILAQ